MGSVIHPFGDSSNAEPWLQQRIVLILCGLVASGKSSFAEHLQIHYPRFKRCNQDDLGDRRQVERLARQSLSQGLSVCIDRTNFDSWQRSHWVRIARDFPGTLVWVIVFDTPYEICAARLKSRKSHPTIKTPEDGLAVLSKFANDFEPPASREGHERILYLKPEDHISPDYTRSEISAILQRVYDSPPVQPYVRFHQRQSIFGHDPYDRRRERCIGAHCVPSQTHSRWPTADQATDSRPMKRNARFI